MTLAFKLTRAAKREMQEALERNKKATDELTAAASDYCLKHKVVPLVRVVNGEGNAEDRRAKPRKD